MIKPLFVQLVLRGRTAFWFHFRKFSFYYGNCFALIKNKYNKKMPRVNFVYSQSPFSFSSDIEVYLKKSFHFWKKRELCSKKPLNRYFIGYCWRGELWILTVSGLSTKHSKATAGKAAYWVTQVKYTWGYVAVLIHICNRTLNRWTYCRYISTPKEVKTQTNKRFLSATGTQMLKAHKSAVN